MNVHVVGAGAIGGIVAAHLTEAGHEVTVVDANEEHVRRIQADGLSVRGAATISVPVQAYLPAEVPGPMRVVLLAVKARHTDDAMRSVMPLLEPDGCVVSLQNGLEEARIARWVGSRRVIGALLTFGGHYESPGVIRYTGSGTFMLGELAGTRSDRVRRLATVLSDAFQPTTVTDNILGALWCKAAIGAAWFATALVDEDVPVLLALPEYRPVFEQLVREVVGVARAERVTCMPLDGFDPNVFAAHPVDREKAEQAWAAQDRYWRSHGQGRTGVWRDLAVHHRQTEADWILAPVVEIAGQRGVDVPLLARLLGLIHRAERGEVKPGTEWLDDLRATLADVPVEV